MGAGVGHANVPPAPVWPPAPCPPVVAPLPPAPPRPPDALPPVGTAVPPAPVTPPVLARPPVSVAPPPAAGSVVAPEPLPPVAPLAPVWPAVPPVPELPAPPPAPEWPATAIPPVDAPPVTLGVAPPEEPQASSAWVKKKTPPIDNTFRFMSWYCPKPAACVTKCAWDNCFRSYGDWPCPSRCAGALHRRARRRHHGMAAFAQRYRRRDGLVASNGVQSLRINSGEHRSPRKTT